jgi:DNA-binding transcriptional MerR regulator
VGITTDQILTADTAKILKVSPERVRQLHAAGLLHPIRTPNGMRIFSRSEVLALRDQREATRKAAVQ